MLLVSSDSHQTKLPASLSQSSHAFLVNFYESIVRKLLWQLDAEKAHHLGLKAAQAMGARERLQERLQKKSKKLTEHRQKFPSPFGELLSPVGLAAGLDKNAVALWGWQAMGFGFVEIGTVTPRPQSGNEKPRLFRISERQALINRMGFNNDGAAAIAARVAKAKDQGLRIPIGGNLGKNATTAIQRAADDYNVAAKKMAPVCDYLVINVSSPNTKGLRTLQGEDDLTSIVQAVRSEAPSKPLFIKIAPDEFEIFQDGILNVVARHKLTGVICGNTTVQHEGPQGGMSGAPLKERNLKLLSSYREKWEAHYQKEFQHSPYWIGVGGIFSPKDALDYMKAGAQLVQVYSGFIYRGPFFPMWIYHGAFKDSSRS